MENAAPPPEDPSEGSSQASAAVPPQAVTLLSQYLSMIDDYVHTYSGELYACTFEDWERWMRILFDNHEIPEQFRVKIGELQLRSDALRYWDLRRGEFGPDVTWPTFATLMANRFRLVSDLTRWNEHATQFRQGQGEPIIDFGYRFDAQIVDTFPLPPPMSDLLKMRIYCRAIRRCYRLPRPAVPYHSFAELRAAHDLIIDEDVVPHGPAVPVPVVPEPAPAPPAAPAAAPPPAPEIPVVDLVSSDEDSD